MTSLAESFRRTAETFAGLPAVLTATQRVDFATFDAGSDRVAGALAQHGIGKGDRVALYCPNSAEFALAYAGIIKAGGTVVPINLLLNREEIAFILRDAGVQALIFHVMLAEAAAWLREAEPGLKFSVAIGGEVSGALSWSEWLATAAECPAVTFDPSSDLASILYTSGTTGRPKGAMLSHGNLLANVASVREAMQWRPGEDVVLVVLPMFHAFAATVGMLTPLLNGCAFVPLARFDPENVAQSIQSSRATIFLGVPSMFSMLLRLKEDRVPLLESLRFCVSGGAALPVEVLSRFEDKFGKRIYEGDGPTECSPVTCVNPIGGLAKPGTVGLPLPGVEMKIVTEDGGDAVPGEIGEIAVRGANVFQGYWNQREATREVFRGEWFLTGDLGTQDEDGYFSIVDRKKDLIIVNGMNVYPRIIEEVLYRFPAVKEAAVVGQPHPLHGEIPVAYVVLHEESAATAAEIRAWCRRSLGRHQVPRAVEFIAALPRNAAGKVLKRQLRRGGEVERGVVDLQ